MPFLNVIFGADFWSPVTVTLSDAEPDFTSQPETAAALEVDFGVLFAFESPPPEQAVSRRAEATARTAMEADLRTERTLDRGG
ncbi:hypothetical protein GCM10022287_35280 [Gryllotalpicola koreensis]|uniref:Uncharacterized protein n=1 Tax=Gryllotalpicola koreensis TaxID=993086 RepID=A0ABP8AAX1_9MICO